MRIKIIDDLINETERIFSAGARLAPADPRLKKYIETLQVMGEKSPPLKKLGEKFSALFNANEDNAGEALIEASKLLFSIAAVMSETTQKGEELDEKENNAYITDLRFSYLNQDQIDFLRKISSGTSEFCFPYEWYTPTYKYFDDIRFYRSIAHKIGGQSEFANLFVKVIIPTMSKDLIPFILEEMQEKPKPKGMNNLISALDKLGYEDVETYALELLKSKTYSSVITAFEILSKNPENRPLLEQRYTEIAKDFSTYQNKGWLLYHMAQLIISIGTPDEIFEHYQQYKDVINEPARSWQSGGECLEYTNFVTYFGTIYSKNEPCYFYDFKNSQILDMKVREHNAIIYGNEKWKKELEDNEDLFGLCVYYFNDYPKFYTYFVKLLIKISGSIKDGNIPNSFYEKVVVEGSENDKNNISRWLRGYIEDRDRKCDEVNK
ncbi:MAG: hypothetical protein LBM93_08380, partial [Oscillospiraceae bacterium]|nr:hypothetical protein [Oscillospiraceae bacterium]